MTDVMVGQPPKDFEAIRQARLKQRQLAFTVAGVTLEVKPFVPPETMSVFTEGTEGKSPFEVYDEFVRRMVVDGAQWDKLRREADPPLNLQDIEDVVYWLVEAAAGRPIERPSSSGRGPRASQDTSRERSRLQTT